MMYYHTSSPCPGSLGGRVLPRDAGAGPRLAHPARLHRHHHLHPRDLPLLPPMDRGQVRPGPGRIPQLFTGTGKGNLQKQKHAPQPDH